jgi:hypothetical protein
MLGNLDNEVIFKKAFTDKIVFTQFVKDILDLDVEIGIIETEKKFLPKIGYIDFELDIFAESVDKRIVIEIQKVEYDHNFDRFLHYFLMVIAEQQKRSKEYGIEQTVYMIVVLTAPYSINQKNGKAVKDEVLLINLNPRNLKGEEIDIYGHQSGGVPLVCLNPNHPDKDTPAKMRDWLDLIYQSIHSPERPIVNENNRGIKRAVDLISFENLTPEERTKSKNKEASMVVIAKIGNARVIEVAKNGIAKGYDNQVISDMTELSEEDINALGEE